MSSIEAVNTNFFKCFGMTLQFQIYRLYKANSVSTALMRQPDQKNCSFNAILFELFRLRQGPLSVKDSARILNANNLAPIIQLLPVWV